MDMIGLKMERAVDQAAHSAASKSQFLFDLILFMSKKKRTAVSIHLAREVGRLSFEFDPVQLVNYSVETFSVEKLASYPMGVCYWKGGVNSYATIDYSNSDVIVCDRLFKLKQRFKNAFTLKPVRLESNLKNLFYILDKATCFVSILEVVIVNGQQELAILHEIRESCKDICFFEEQLYALCVDSSTNVAKLNIFSSLGVLKSSLSLAEVTFKQVTSLRISVQFAVLVEAFSVIKLFEMPSGKLKVTLTLGVPNVACICFADSYLLALSPTGDLKFYALSQREDFVISESMVTSEISGSLPKSEAYSIGYFDKKLVISYPWKKQFCILK